MKRFIPIFFLINLLCLSFPLIAAENNEADPEAEISPSTEPQYSSVEERRLLVALKEERLNLQNERDALSQEKKDLKRLESEVDKKLDELKSLRTKIQGLLAEKDAEEQRRVQELSKMYEKMTSEKAAAIIATLDQDLAIDLLAQMKTKAAAKVLGNMNRDKAAKLTAAFSSLESK